MNDLVLLNLIVICLVILLMGLSILFVECVWIYIKWDKLFKIIGIEYKDIDED